MFMLDELGMAWHDLGSTNNEFVGSVYNAVTVYNASIVGLHIFSKD